MARVVWLANPASSKMFNRTLKLSSGKKVAPSLRPQRASWILASTTNRVRRLDGQVQDHEPGEVGEEFLQNAEIAW